MPNIVSRNSLWTPEGEKALVQQEKDVRVVSKEEGVTFRNMHRFAQRYRIGLWCMLCDKPIQGGNSGNESVQSVACECRELRFPNPTV